MLRTATISVFAFALATANAFAHPGHIAAESGHDHGVAYLAAGLAVIIAAGAVALVQSRR